MNTRRSLIFGISTLSALLTMAALPALAKDDWDFDATVRAVRHDIIRDEDRIRDLECRKREADRFHDRDESRRLQWDINKAKYDLREDRCALDRAIDAARRAHRDDRGGRVTIRIGDRHSYERDHRDYGRDRRDYDRRDWR